MSALEPIVVAVAEALQPLGSALQDPTRMRQLLASLGWNLPVTSAHLAVLRSAIPIVDTLKAIDTTRRTLASGSGNRADAIADLLVQVTRVVEVVRSLASLNAKSLASLPDALSNPEVWSDLASALPDQLLARWLASHARPLDVALRLLGLCVEERPRAGAPTRARYRWNQIGQVLADPAAAVKATTGWNLPISDQRFSLGLATLLAQLGARVRLHPMQAAVAAAIAGKSGTPPSGIECEVLLHESLGSTGFVRIGAVLAPTLALTGTSGLYVGNLLTGGLNPKARLSPDWTLTAEATAQGTAVIGVRFQTSGATLVKTGATARTLVRLEGAPAQPWILLGSTAGTRLELAAASLALGIEATSIGAETWAELAMDHGNLALVLDFGAADSFLRSIVGENVRCEAGGMLRWSSTQGLSFDGGTGLSVTIPLGLSLGPVYLSSMGLALAGSPNAASIEATLSASLLLGPVSLSADRIGAALNLLPSSKNQPIAGLQATLDFIPPSGYGLAIDASVASGSGYLAVDAATCEYQGAASLNILGVGVSAIGILTTQPVAGADWSLLLSICTRFIPIPLGFGFTLNGVGGLVAIHRTMNPAVLQAGLADGSLDALLFPGPVVNGPALFDLLGSAFPVAAGQYTFGPMIEIGWGVPTLFEARLGILICLPDPIRIALIGQFEALLPTPELALIELRFDVLGVIDLAAGEIAIDAVLRNSRIVGLSLAGAMAFRADFVGNATFLLSFGGFHPDFTPPAGVPDLPRLGVALDLGDNCQVGLEAYFAITSNTLQAGARLHAVAQSGAFTAEGNCGFNALIEFDPFAFVTELFINAEVRSGRTTLAAVALTLTFSGPRPWHVVGRAEFEFLSLPVHFRVEASLGGGSADPVVPTVDVLPLLLAALRDPASWCAVAAAASDIVLRSSTDKRLVDPDGRIEVRQRITPLDLEIDRFGNRKATGTRLFSLTSAKIGTTDTSSSTISDWFAPSSFFDLSRNKRLTSPSFERYNCGLQWGDDLATSSARSETTLEYESITLDARTPKTSLPAGRLGSDRLPTPGTSRGRLKPLGLRRSTRPPSIGPALFAVSRTDTGKQATDVLPKPSTWMNAHRALEDFVRARPSRRGKYQIVPADELPASTAP